MDKKALRAEYKSRRKAIPTSGKQKLDSLIRKRITETPEFRKAKTVLLYAPVQGEIDLLPLAQVCRELGKEVGFPISMSDGTLQFRSPESGESLITGTYGIPEPPKTAKESTLDEHTLCIVPALTFDRNGNRLGYGKGYYDRFLQHFTGMTMGAVYQKLIADELPAEPHDRPVDMLVHEGGVLSCRREDRSLHAYADRMKARLRRTLYERLTPLRKLIRRQLRPNERAKAEAAETLGARIAAPLLVLSTFLLLLLSRLIEGAITQRGSAYAAVVLLQIFIFILPAILYIKLQGEAFQKRIRIRVIRLPQLWFCLCTLVVMITSSLLISILTGGINSLSGNFTLYQTFVARINGSVWETLYIVLAYALLPAICEELIYRSILCAEYEAFGTAVSVFVSALFFSMLHFSFPLFLNYLVLGILLAVAMYTTRSALAPLLLHLCYNLFCLFGQPYLSAFYVNAGSREIFLFCLITLLLLFSAFAAGEARKIYHLYARANLSSDYTVSVRLSDYPKRLFAALKTPAIIPVLLLWLIMAIADLFVS